MFKNCISLEKLILPKLNSFYLYDTNEMFYGCYKLTSLDISTLNTINVKKMEKMFFNCFSLTYLDIRKFNTRILEHCEDIFSGIGNSKSFNIIYNHIKTNELADQIMSNWNITHIS